MLEFRINKYFQELKAYLYLSFESEGLKVFLKLINFKNKIEVNATRDLFYDIEINRDNKYIKNRNKNIEKGINTCKKNNDKMSLLLSCNLSFGNHSSFSC